MNEKLINKTKTRFPLGRIVATPGALDLAGESPLIGQLIRRHASGDWGDLGESDRRLNEEAIANGDRIHSAYNTPVGRFWIMTEHDRSVTTVLLPEEY